MGHFKKIMSICAFLSFVLSISVGAEEEKRVYIIDSFEGMNSHASPYILKKSQAVELRNMRVNERYGTASKRKTMLTYGSTGAGPNTILHRYYNSSGTQKLIAGDTTILYYGDDAAGTLTAMGIGFTSGKWWDAVNYDDVAILTNGYDQPVKWDGSTNATANTTGHRTASYLVAELGAPFAELLTGTDLDAAAWYQYKIAWYDGTTYSFSNARSNAILTGAAVHNIALTDIPIGPTGTTHRYIYRTLGNSSAANVAADDTFYLVGTLANNTASTFSDTVADDDADDDAAPTWTTASAGTNVTPPVCKFALIHDERLFLAGDLSNPSDLNWSDEYNPDYFAPTDYERIREDDGDSIMFIENQPGTGILTVGKQNSIQRYYTDSSSASDWYASDPISHEGCCAPYSVAVSPLGIFYVNWGGIYRFTGQHSQLVSDAVTPEIRDIIETNMDEVSGVYWKNEYNLAYSSLASGSQTNNRVLVYDIVRDAYSLDHKNVNRWCKFDAGTDFGILYSGGSNSTGTIYAQEGTARLFDKRYKSELDAGTFDDTRSTGTEDDPELELGWDCTIDGWLTELQTKDSDIDTIDEIETYLPDAIIDRPDTDGTWVSPVYAINAAQFDKLYWNEDLGEYGDVTVQFRVGSTAAACASASYGSEYTDPSGSDISAVTANNYIQFRFNLSTDDIEHTPVVYVIDNYFLKLTYSKRGTTYESNFTSKWKSGWLDFGTPYYKKDLYQIKVYYASGGSGEITVNYKNDEGDIDESFTIDLSVLPPVDEKDTDNSYKGTEDHRIYTYYTDDNSDGCAPQGTVWQFSISDESTDVWSIEKIVVIYDLTQAD